VQQTIDAEVIVLATGFERPKIDFLDDSLFPEDYQRPDLYLQNFSTEDWSVLLTNSSYSSGIGGVSFYIVDMLLTFVIQVRCKCLGCFCTLVADILLALGCSGHLYVLAHFSFVEEELTACY
jgi:hypothetical protein